MTRCVTRSSSSRHKFAMKILLSTTEKGHAQRTKRKKKKYLGSLFSVKKKIEQQQFSQAFRQNMCVLKQQNKKKGVKKRQHALQREFYNRIHKIISHLNSSQFYLKYGSMKSGSRRSCVHKFNRQCAFNS